MQKPVFNVTRGTNAAMQMEPPFTFDGVSMRVLPLRANPDTLQSFVNRYLNICPDEVGEFRAYVPYVYLMVLDYGRMSVEQSNAGWIAQREIAFSVPMEWYKVDGRGKLQFHDWAYCSPFIFVDNELSMATGREVYGWPKSIVSLDHEISRWMKDPVGGRKLASVSAMVFPEMYSGRTEQSRTFFEIKTERAAGTLGWPPNPRNLLFPWVSVPAAI